jgi:hypothetical protein
MKLVFRFLAVMCGVNWIYAVTQGENAALQFAEDVAFSFVVLVVTMLVFETRKVI